MGPICPQIVDDQSDDALKPEWYKDAKAYILRQSLINMSEDCLYLNIYAPMEIYVNGKYWLLVVVNIFSAYST